MDFQQLFSNIAAGEPVKFEFISTQKVIELGAAIVIGGALAIYLGNKLLGK